MQPSMGGKGVPIDRNPPPIFRHLQRVTLYDVGGLECQSANDDQVIAREESMGAMLWDSAIYHSRSQ